MANLPFASTADVAARMGLATLSAPQQIQATALLTSASDLILDAVSKTADWAESMDVVPSALRTTAVEMTVRILQNPGGVRSQAETLGDHTHSASFADSTAVLELTKNEELRCARAVHGSTTASPRLGSILDEVGPLLGRTGSQFYVDDNGAVEFAPYVTTDDIDEVTTP